MALVILVAASACGKKGPPLAPFVRVPAAVAGVTPQRIGDDIYLSFAVPSTNADGQKPATLGSLEVYAVTSEKTPETEKQRDVAMLIATVPVREILPPLPVPENGSAPPPIPVMPGVEQGATIAVREAFTADMRTPVELPVEKLLPLVPVAEVVDEAPIDGPLVAPEPTQLPRRHYFVIGVSPRGRKSAPSPVVSLPLDSGSSAPGKPAITNTISDVTITWTAPPDARTSTFFTPPAVKPVPPAANASPANVTAKAPPPPLPPLTAKSLGFNTQATTYHVYDVTQPPATDDPYAIKPPTPLTAAPIADTEFVIKGVTFEVERCFEVRPVDQVFGTTVIGPASPRACITPQDTFPPAAPKTLAAIAGAGVISLIWDANTESDLAGYIVLRGEAPGDTLQAITPEPIAATVYRDETVKPGVRYVYAVVAVDRATPQNVSAQSNRAEETARQ